MLKYELKKKYARPLRGFRIYLGLVFNGLPKKCRWMFPKIVGFPKSIPLKNRGFSINYKPSILGVVSPYFWSYTDMVLTSTLPWDFGSVFSTAAFLYSTPPHGFSRSILPQMSWGNGTKSCRSTRWWRRQLSKKLGASITPWKMNGWNPKNVGFKR